MKLSRSQIIDLNPRNFTFTSASMDLFEACPASAVFNGPKEKFIHGGLWYGIFVHRFLEYVTNKGPDAALKYIRAKGSASKGSAANALATCEKIDIDSIPMGEAEVGLAHDLARNEVRRVYGMHDRASKWEAFGKADLVFSDGDLVHVSDYKCGWLDGDPSVHAQLLGLACAVRVEKKVERVKVSLVGVAGTGALHWNTATLSSAHMDHFEDRMKRTHLRMLNDRTEFHDVGVVPEFVPGDHCDRCHCRTVCPALSDRT